MLTTVQCRIAAEMLELAADEFGNHSCNDYKLLNTLENMEFVRQMIAASDYPEDEPTISSSGEFIYVMDWQVMRFCRNLLIQQSLVISD